MMKRGWLQRMTAAMLCAMLCACSAEAELALPDSLLGRDALGGYLTRAHDYLSAAHERMVNSVFLCGLDVASVGVTDEDGAEIPEGVEMTFITGASGPQTLELRASSPSRFLPVAAACIAAASQEEMSWEDALAAVQPHVRQAEEAPSRSFEDDVIPDQGTEARTYFAYYPNQYQDGESWLQMTLVFPLDGFDGGVMVTPRPTPKPEFTGEFEGIDVKDSYNHFEVFVSPTPEPDSPAGQQGNR